MRAEHKTATPTSKVLATILLVVGPAGAPESGTPPTGRSATIVGLEGATDMTGVGDLMDPWKTPCSTTCSMKTAYLAADAVLLARLDPAQVSGTRQAVAAPPNLVPSYRHNPRKTSRHNG